MLPLVSLQIHLDLFCLNQTSLQYVTRPHLRAKVCIVVPNGHARKERVRRDTIYCTILEIFFSKAFRVLLLFVQTVDVMKVVV